MHLSAIFSEGVIVAMIGGLLYAFLAVGESFILPKHKRIEYWTTSFFALVLISILLSGLFGYFYFRNVPPHELNRLLALHIGISVPLFIRTLTGVLSEVSQ